MHMDLQMAWRTRSTAGLVNFAERIGVKLATFAVLKLISDLSYALSSLFCSFCHPISYRLCVAMVFSDICHLAQALGNLLIALL